MRIALLLYVLLSESDAWLKKPAVPVSAPLRARYSSWHRRDGRSRSVAPLNAQEEEETSIEDLRAGDIQQVPVQFDEDPDEAFRLAVKRREANLAKKKAGKDLDWIPKRQDETPEILKPLKEAFTDNPYDSRKQRQAKSTIRNIFAFSGVISVIFIVLWYAFPGKFISYRGDRGPMNPALTQQYIDPEEVLREDAINTQTQSFYYDLLEDDQSFWGPGRSGNSTAPPPAAVPSDNRSKVLSDDPSFWGPGRGKSTALPPEAPKVTPDRGSAKTNGKEIEL